jgi:hypothetical protein
VNKNKLQDSAHEVKEKKNRNAKQKNKIKWKTPKKIGKEN